MTHYWRFLLSLNKRKKRLFDKLDFLKSYEMTITRTINLSNLLDYFQTLLGLFIDNAVINSLVNEKEEAKEK